MIRYIVTPLHRIYVSTIQRFNDSTRRSRSSFRAEGAITIIELLVVIIIILILAGLVLSISSYVQNKGARARAETEIAAISAALESYKADNAVYPRSSNTDALDARTSGNPPEATQGNATGERFVRAFVQADVATRASYLYSPSPHLSVHTAFFRLHR